MAAGPIRVFLSSTSQDLSVYREAAVRVCNQLELVPVAMEFFEAMSAGATDGSRQQLQACDLFVGFFAHRYGYVEDGYAASVTELEFDHAAEVGLDRLCFVVAPDYTLPGALDEPHRGRQEAFKARIDRTLVRAQFTTPESFENALWKALRAWLDGLSPALRLLLDAKRLTLPPRLRQTGKLLRAEYQVIPFETAARREGACRQARGLQPVRQGRGARAIEPAGTRWMAPGSVFRARAA